MAICLLSCALTGFLTHLQSPDGSCSGLNCTRGRATELPYQVGWIKKLQVRADGLSSGMEAEEAEHFEGPWRRQKRRASMPVAAHLPFGKSAAEIMGAGGHLHRPAGQGKRCRVTACQPYNMCGHGCGKSVASSAGTCSIYPSALMGAMMISSSPVLAHSRLGVNVFGILLFICT